MKTRSEIEDRIRYLLAEALEAKVRETTARLPHKCKHNHRHPLDTRRQVHGEPNPNYNRITVASHEATTETIGLCMLGATNRDEEWPGDICEDPIDAQRCPYFDAQIDKNKVWREFSAVLRDPDELRAKLPEVAGLIWALAPNDSWFSDLPSKIPWWKRLWFWLLRLRPDPIFLDGRDNYVRLLNQATEGLGEKSPAKSISDPP